MSDETVSEEIATQDDPEIKTGIDAYIDDAGNGHVQVTVDASHGPEVIGALWGAVMNECWLIFSLRGMAKEEMSARILQGISQLNAAQAQEHPIIVPH